MVTRDGHWIITIQTDPDKVHIIPIFSLGFQYKNIPNFKTNLSLGMQYINSESLKNYANTNNILQSHIKKE